MRQLLLASLITSAAFTAPAFAAPENYELDPSHTVVYFTIDHVGYAATLGIFGDVAGSFTYDMDTKALSDVAVTIKAESVNTFNAARDGHVKNKDFLNVSEFPEITFTANSGEASSDTEGTVTGDLTILGKTQPVTLNVKLNKAAAYPFGHKRFVLGLSINGAVKRSEYGMMYAVSNGLVGDEVKFNIETEAMRIE